MMLHSPDRGAGIIDTDLYHRLLIHGNTSIIGQMEYFCSSTLTISKLQLLPITIKTSRCDYPLPAITNTVLCTMTQNEQQLYISMINKSAKINLGDGFWDSSEYQLRSYDAHRSVKQQINSCCLPPAHTIECCLLGCVQAT